MTFLLPFSVGFGLGVTSDSNPLHIIFAFVSFSCWMSFCFVVDAIGDKDVDKFHNGRSKDMNLAYQPLVTGEVTEKAAFYLSMMFFFCSLLFASFINFLFFILILLVDIVGYIYSMPPTRFKTTPAPKKRRNPPKQLEESEEPPACVPSFQIENSENLQKL